MAHLRSLSSGAACWAPAWQPSKPSRAQCFSIASSHMWCDIFQFPSACFSSTFRNTPLCDAFVVWPFCSVVHATSCVPHTYATCPSPRMLCSVITSFVIFVGGAFGGNQNSFRPCCPIRGLSACGTNNTQSSVNSARTPSASPLSHASSYLLCTCLIFATSSADKSFPAPFAPELTSKSETIATALRMLIEPPATYYYLSRLDALCPLPFSRHCRPLL